MTKRPHLARRLAVSALLVALFVVMFVAYRRWVLHAPLPTLAVVRHGTTYEIASPKMLGVALVLPGLLWVLGKSLADLPWPQRVLSVALRFAFVALLGVALARLSRTATTQKVTTVFVVDVSESVTTESLADAVRLVDDARKELPKDDRLRLVTFARRPRVVELPEEPEAPFTIQRHDPAGKPVVLGAGTNVQAALQLAYGLFPPGYLKRVVLVTDGLETDGDALAEVARARELGVRVSTAATRRPPPPEIAIRELVLPPKVKVGEGFEVKADVYSSRAAKARARLFQGETLNGLGGVKELELAPGSNPVVFKSIVRVAGEVTYALELDELSADTFKENNRVSTTIDVPGRPTVLYVEGAQAHASYLQGALSAQQYDVEVRGPGAFPASQKELERFDFVILSDVPADRFGADAQALVEAYVREGGGFLYAGGEHGYALGGWRGTTMERILPVRMDGEPSKETPGVALSLVIDRSGSMAGTPMEMAKAAAKAAVDVLAPSDMVEVIAFDTAPIRAVKMQAARRRGRIAGEIAKIQPGGGTEIFPALDAAYQDLSVTAARRKHVILLTDGASPPAGIREVVAAMAAEGITVTTVGLGTSLDEGLLTMIKEVGGGRFHKVPDAANLPRIFTQETETVSRQAAQEDWFQPRLVGAASFLHGIDFAAVPNLHGFVKTQMKPAPAQEILESETGEPILARWRVGVGWSLAWTSDLKNRWAVEWLRWPVFSQVMGQLVREHMRQKQRREFDLKTELHGGEVHAVIDAFSSDDRFENGLDSTLTVVGPAPSQEKRELPMKQTAPGRYEASFSLEKYGSFLLRAEHKRADGDKKTKSSAGVSYGYVNNPYPVEYARFEPDRGLLLRLAEGTGGRIDPSFAEARAPGDEKIVFHEALWSKAVLAAIVVFLLDLLVRRVRLFDRKVTAIPARAR